MKKRLLALLLCFSLFVSAFSVNALGIFETFPLSESTILNTVEPINYDDEFPLGGEILVQESTIHFIETDCYECDYAVEKDTLEASVKLWDKDNLNDFTFTLTDESTGLSHTFNSTSQQLTITNFAIDKYYSFYLTINNCNYMGKIGLCFETCNVLYLDFCYMQESTDIVYGENTRNASFQRETENNNTYSTADTVTLGNTIIGSLDSSIDKDYFYFDLSDYNSYSNFTNGYFAINLNVNNSASSCTLELFAKQGSSYNRLAIGSSASVNDKYIFYNNSSKYTQFYICVTSTISSSTNTSAYYLNINYNANYPFYSQKVGAIGDIELWNTQFLDQLTFNNGLPFITTNNTTDSDMMSSGCAIASYAMALKRLGATMPGKDFRTGFMGQLYADPFVVMLANVDENGTSLTNFTSNTMPYNDPVYLYDRSTLVGYFNVSGNNIYSHVSDVESLTLSQKMEELDNLLNYNGNNGVILTFTNDYGNPHFMYCTGYNSTKNDSEERYFVLDPAGTNFAHASILPFVQCISSTRTGAYHFDFDDLVAIHYVNTNSTGF